MDPLQPEERSSVLLLQLPWIWLCLRLPGASQQLSRLVGGTFFRCSIMAAAVLMLLLLVLQST